MTGPESTAPAQLVARIWAALVEGDDAVAAADLVAALELLAGDRR